MTTIELTTTVEVIKALGGVKAVAALTNRTPGAAWNWTTFPTFPSDTYVAMQQELAKLGHSAPPSLWRMATPAVATAS
jgi:hypothetical protein